MSSWGNELPSRDSNVADEPMRSGKENSKPSLPLNPRILGYKSIGAPHVATTYVGSKAKVLLDKLNSLLLTPAQIEVPTYIFIEVDYHKNKVWRKLMVVVFR